MNLTNVVEALTGKGQSRKIGVFGGTFNPIHNGHLAMAVAAKSQYQLDEVWLMPSGTPPHKTMACEVTSDDRMEMCRCAISGENAIHFKDWCLVDDTEIHCVNPNYSYKTMAFFKEKYPEFHFYFIIGEDSLRYFHEWAHPEIICHSATILVAVRNETGPEKENQIPRESMTIDETIEFLSQRFSSEFKKILMDPVDMSSTKIREAAAKGDSLAGMVPREVESYINEHGLYRTPIPMDAIHALRKILKKKLKPTRYKHTVGVMQTCGNLAMRHSYPVNAAILAGLLHDCTKYFTDDEQFEFCRKKGIEMTNSERKTPSLLHAKTGSYVAEHKYGVEDPDVLHAIRVHTMGAPEMNLLDKILFVADYIEPNREKAPRLTELRRIAYEDLDLAVTMILADTIHYLSEKAQSMDPTTLKTYEYYRDLMQKRGEDLTLMEAEPEEG